MSSWIPTYVQLIVEDPAGRALLAKKTQGGSVFGYLEALLDFDEGLERLARHLLHQATGSTAYPTLTRFGIDYGPVISRLQVVYQQRLEQEIELPEPTEGFAEWRWFESDKIKDNRKIAKQVRHDYGEIIGITTDEYLVSGKRPQWPQPPMAA